eukprot:7588962-Ditylum_brightwellii.AAC.1
MPTPSLPSSGHKAPVLPDQLATTTELFNPPSGYLTLSFTMLALLSITSSDPFLLPVQIPPARNHFLRNH